MKKTKQIGIRVSDVERRLIEKEAHKRHMTISELVRIWILAQIKGK